MERPISSSIAIHGIFHYYELMCIDGMVHYDNNIHIYIYIYIYIGRYTYNVEVCAHMYIYIYTYTYIYVGT